jgi:hypothetical protein
LWPQERSDGDSPGDQKIWPQFQTQGHLDVSSIPFSR